MKELKEETSTQKIYWDSENEIVWGKIIADIKTEEQAKQIIDAHERVRNNMNIKKTRVIIDMTELTNISKDARNYLANERTASIQRAVALLTGKPISRIIGNFFLGLDKPITPTKLFTNSEEAIKWLHTFGNE